MSNPRRRYWLFHSNVAGSKRLVVFTVRHEVELSLLKRCRPSRGNKLRERCGVSLNA